MLHVAELNRLERQYAKDLCEMTLDALYAWDNADDFDALCEDLADITENRDFEETVSELVLWPETKQLRIENIVNKIKTEAVLNKADLDTLKDLIDVWGFCDPLYESNFVKAFEIRLSIA